MATHAVVSSKYLIRTRKIASRPQIVCYLMGRLTAPPITREAGKRVIDSINICLRMSNEGREGSFHQLSNAQVAPTGVFFSSTVDH